MAKRGDIVVIHSTNPFDPSARYAHQVGEIIDSWFDIQARSWYRVRLDSGEEIETGSYAFGVLTPEEAEDRRKRFKVIQDLKRERPDLDAESWEFWGIVRKRMGRKGPLVRWKTSGRNPDMTLKKEILQKAVTILRQITDETDGWVAIAENGWHISTSIPGVVDASIWLMEDKWEAYSYVPLEFPIRLKDVADFLRMTIKKGETISLRVDADKREFLITHALDRQFTRGFRWSEDDAEYMKQTHGMGTVQEARTYEAKFAVNTRELKKSLKLKDIDRLVLATRDDVCFFLLLSGTELVAKVEAEIDTVRAPTELRHSSYSFIRAFKYLPDTVTMKFNHLGHVVMDSMVDGFLSVVVIADALDPETSAEIEDLLRKEIAPEVKVEKIPEVIKVKIPEKVPEKPVKIPEKVPEIAAEQLEMRKLRTLQEKVCGDLPIHEKDRCKGAMVLYAKDLVSKEEFEQTLDELSVKSKFMEAIQRLGSEGMGTGMREFRSPETMRLWVNVVDETSQKHDERVYDVEAGTGWEAIQKLLRDIEGFVEKKYEVIHPVGEFFKSPLKLDGRMMETLSAYRMAGKQGESVAELRNAYEEAKRDLREAMKRHSPGAIALESYREKVQRTKKEYEAAHRGDEELPAILRWCPDPNFVAMVKYWIQKKGRVEPDLERKLIAKAHQYNMDPDDLFHQMSMIASGNPGKVSAKPGWWTEELDLKNTEDRMKLAKHLLDDGIHTIDVVAVSRIGLVPPYEERNIVSFQFGN